MVVDSRPGLSWFLGIFPSLVFLSFFLSFFPSVSCGGQRARGLYSDGLWSLMFALHVLAGSCTFIKITHHHTSSFSCLWSTAAAAKCPSFLAYHPIIPPSIHILPHNCIAA
ncbi:hypothetical protein BZA05DRAFT_136043 [Tricharina praecox]|uniref:uncharacterized protein n=1 Tax=Tricharina praecox TaxID=43433 RepID=UPI00222060A4|nr:uncharacterized protein BZA05DRAFT_136043 [Tricharina praecox]KAI5846786.1 hypothetical protein BZA05DRAFT_136043 [Tricharina praecox]